VKNGYFVADEFSSMQNTRFEGLVVMTKNGSGNNDFSGGNTFVGPVAIINNGNGRMRFAVSNADVFQGVIHFEENGSGEVEPAYNGINTFSGDISSTGSLDTVTFGAGNGQAVITGFTTVYGSPRFKRLTINSNSGQISFFENKVIDELRVYKGTLDMEGNTLTVVKAIFSGGTVTDGTLNFLNNDSMTNTSFEGALLLRKIGGSNNIVNGGNTFGSYVFIENNSSSLWRLANVTGDDFNGYVEFRENSTGQLEPAYNGNNTFAGDVSTNNSSGVITFAAGNGFMIINGNVFQSMVGSTSRTPVIGRLTVNTSGVFYLNGTNLRVTTSLSFTSGIIQSSSGNELIFGDDAFWTGAKNTSHVDGPVIKIGNDAFTFPVGDGSFYAPIGMGAPSNNSDAFSAEYINSPYSNTTTMGSGLDHVSINEHWILDRVNGSSNVTVTLFWNKFRHGGVTSLVDMRVARWSGSQWTNHGNGNVTGNETAGSVTSSAAITDFSPFTLGSSNTLNPLPVSLISFDATPVNQSVKVVWATSNELNNDRYIVEKSFNGTEWSAIGTVKGLGNSNSVAQYSFIDAQPQLGIQYYRLKQVDLNGEFAYSEIKPVAFNHNQHIQVSLFPNPANNQVNINLPSNENMDAKLTVFNALGQVVLELSNLSATNFSFDCSNFETGIYNIELSFDGHVQHVKFLKQ
ncbi:MAG: T9SS type A sorting domain-containing protein, partial [Bacteroidetes bacterium]|nr:T9SS type A sorting domain-containing protein [Bacteroidota bacterium]